MAKCSCKKCNGKSSSNKAHVVVEYDTQEKIFTALQAFFNDTDPICNQYTITGDEDCITITSKICGLSNIRRNGNMLLEFHGSYVALVIPIRLSNLNETSWYKLEDDECEDLMPNRDILSIEAVMYIVYNLNNWKIKDALLLENQVKFQIVPCSEKTAWAPFIQSPQSIIAHQVFINPITPKTVLEFAKSLGTKYLKDLRDKERSWCDQMMTLYLAGRVILDNFTDDFVLPLFKTVVKLVLSKLE